MRDRGAPVGGGEDQPAWVQRLVAVGRGRADVEVKEFHRPLHRIMHLPRHRLGVGVRERRGWRWRLDGHTMPQRKTKRKLRLR